jgi:hypothetical protein
MEAVEGGSAKMALDVTPSKLWHHIEGVFGYLFSQCICT